MFKRIVGRLAKALVGVVAASSALSAHAQPAQIDVLEYTYNGYQLTDMVRTDRWGTTESKFQSDGIAFGFYVQQPIQSGQTVSFTGQGSTFTGVMGASGAFASWSFEWCSWDGGACRRSIYDGGSARDEVWSMPYGTVTITNSNTGTPGVWSTGHVMKWEDSWVEYNAPVLKAWVSPVPEADASVMAVLGLAAVGAMVRRKAKAQTEARPQVTGVDTTEQA